jgi:hypothetical protein
MSLLTTTPGVLPRRVLQRVRTVVATATRPERMGALGPNPYHVTFWYALDAKPRNLVEAVVRHRLHPRLPADARGRVAGVEWWLGRLAPPYAANFDFGAHRDFGEHPASGTLESPLLSSIFYLTTVDDGALAVYAGEPFAGGVEYFFPRENTFVFFPGHLWHAILSRRRVPGAPPSPASSTGLRLTLTVNWWPYRPAGTATPPMKLVAADYDGSVYPELRGRLRERPRASRGATECSS